MTRSMRLALVGLVAGVVTALTAPLVLAAVRTDTGDHFSLPGGTKISLSLKTGTKFTLAATIDKIAVTSSCTRFASSTALPGRGLGPFSTSTPTFGGCTDSVRGTDTYKTSGTYTLKLIDAPNDAAAEKPGDKLSLGIPKAGLVISTTAAPGCTIKVAPSAPAALTASYDDVRTATFKNASVPFATSAACPGGAATGRGTVTGTVVLSRSVHDT